MLAEALEQTGVARLIGWHEDDDGQGSVVSKAWAAAIYPFQLAIRPTAIKAYLTTLLFLFTSFVLLSISTGAFTLFYYNYIPQTDLERPIYLQYAAGTHPRAEFPLKSNVLISQQPYDVSIVLNMPRTRTNMEAGNFMLDLTLHGKIDSIEASALKTLRMENQVSSSSLHHSRRPAMLPHSSALTSLASTLLHLPLHLTAFHDLDSVTLTVPMFEELEFARGKDKIPTYVELEVQSQTDHTLPMDYKCKAPQLQVHSAKIVFQVRFHGLRYLFYNYRMLAFTVFTGLFYTTSISTLAVAWALIATFLLPPKNDDRSLIKSETKESRIKSEQDISDPLRTASDYTSEKEHKSILRGSDRDTPTTFPTLGRNARRLEYTPQISEPASAASSQDQAAADVQPEDNEQAHADDEDEESEDEWQQLQRMRERVAREARQRQMQHDSGIGTSLESENTGRGLESGLTRRRSQRSSDGGRKE